MTRFKNKKIVVMGLGLHGGGVGVVRFFAKQGASVLVTDLKNKEQLAESLKKLKGLPVKFVLGGHKEHNFAEADLIVKNPDVPNSSPYLIVAKKNNIPVETDISLFFKLSGAFVIGVTGTKGKSTTASLIYHFLKQSFSVGKKKVFLAGNIGTSPLEILDKIKNGDVVVLEFSSFALEDLEKSPQIAVITNMLPDHLNRYANMSSYINAKKIIFKHQSKKDFLVLNKDDSIVRQFAGEARSNIKFFSGDTLKPEGFKVLGKHNLANLAAAIEVARLMKVSDVSIKKSIKTFKGVPNRQELVAEIKSVKYFNDTTATMPEAVVQAINSFSENFPSANLIFICGGQNKGLDYYGLATAIKSRVGELILLPGTASEKIKELLLNYKKIHKVFSMEQAVKKAKSLAKKGDAVVLSPGAASFNLFKNEFDRGDQFKKFVKKLK